MDLGLKHNTQSCGFVQRAVLERMASSNTGREPRQPRMPNGPSYMHAALHHFLPYSLRSKGTRWLLRTCLGCVYLSWNPLHRGGSRQCKEQCLPADQCMRLTLACHTYKLLPAMIMYIPRFFGKVDVVFQQLSCNYCILRWFATCHWHTVGALRL